MSVELSERTSQVYQGAIDQFEDFCTHRGISAFPSDGSTVCAFLKSRVDAGDKAGTLSLKRSAIATRHRSSGLIDPTTDMNVRELLRKSRKGEIDADKKRVSPITRDVLHRMIEVIDAGNIQGIRDRAVLLLGFACALRRSELVALDVADLQLTAAELRVRIRKSKTDQSGAGAEIAVPAIGGELCPVAAVRAWLDIAKINSGPIFRRFTRYGHVMRARLSAQSVAMIVKKWISVIGLDEVAFSGHSLRVGFCTQAVIANMPDDSAMAITRHKRRDTYLEYARHRVHLREASASDILGVA